MSPIKEHLTAERTQLTTELKQDRSEKVEEYFKDDIPEYNQHVEVPEQSNELSELKPNTYRSPKSARSDKSITYEDIDRAVRKIQAQTRAMLAWRSFRTSLYRLILLKAIVETKVHKESM